MNRELYPGDWDAIALAVKEEACWVCENCGKQCRRPGERLDTHKRTLTVAHIDHDASNCRRDNLAALCAPCHLKHDAHQHAATRRIKALEALIDDMIPCIIGWAAKFNELGGAEISDTTAYPMATAKVFVERARKLGLLAEGGIR